MYAAHGGHEGILKLLLESGADVFACDDNGNNALHLAVITNEDEFSQNYNRQQIIETLIDCGLNLNSPNFVGDGVLHSSVQQYPYCTRGFEVIEFLISRSTNAALNATNASGRTVVQAIVSKIGRDITCECLQKFLHSHEIDLGVRDIQLKTALDYIICGECRHRAIRSIPALNAHDDKNPSNQSVSYKMKLFADLLYGFRASGSSLKEFPGNILEYWYRHIVTQKDNNHFSGCSFLEETYSYTECHSVLDLNTERDERGRTYLHLVALLKFAGNDAFETSVDEIYWDIEAVEQEMKKNANIGDGCGKTALHYVSYLMRSSQPMTIFLRKVLQLGDVTTRDCYARTPLHYAAMSLGNANSFDIYALLVERGADANAIDKFGDTPQQLRALYKTFAELQAENEIRLRLWKVNLLSECEMPSFTFKFLPTCHKFKFSKRVVKVLPAFEDYLHVYEIRRSTIFMLIYKEMFSAPCSAIPNKCDMTINLLLANITLFQEVKALIGNLVSAVQAVDPRLKGQLLEVGSAYEKKHSGFPDEFDFDVVLTEFSDIFQVSSSPVCPTGYVLLKNKVETTKTVLLQKLT